MQNKLLIYDNHFLCVLDGFQLTKQVDWIDRFTISPANKRISVGKECYCSNWYWRAKRKTNILCVLYIFATMLEAAAATQTFLPKLKQVLTAEKTRNKLIIGICAMVRRVRRQRLRSGILFYKKKIKPPPCKSAFGFRWLWNQSNNKTQKERQSISK